MYNKSQIRKLYYTKLINYKTESDLKLDKEHHIKVS